MHTFELFIKFEKLVHNLLVSYWESKKLKLLFPSVAVWPGGRVWRASVILRRPTGSWLERLLPPSPTNLQLTEFQPGWKSINPGFFHSFVKLMVHLYTDTINIITQETYKIHLPCLMKVLSSLLYEDLYLFNINK